MDFQGAKLLLVPNLYILKIFLGVFIPCYKEKKFKWSEIFTNNAGWSFLERIYESIILLCLWAHVTSFSTTFTGIFSPLLSVFERTSDIML